MSGAVNPNTLLDDLVKDCALLPGRAFIGGEWVSGTSVSPITDPATGKVIASVPLLGADETRAAVAAAHQAFTSWRALLPRERATIIRRWGAEMEASAKDLASIMTAEQGKPIAEAVAEIRYAAGFLDWFADEATHLGATTYSPHLTDRRMLITREPVGVTAAITPWNFPSAMITRKAGAALAAGCTMVVKPAPETPLSALALAVLAERAGVPAGVLSVITGDAAAIGGVLLEDPRVRKLTFTGSTATGRMLYARSASTMKRLSMELGGHAPFLVFADADLDRAVEAAVSAKFVTSGQDCLAVNRILVEAPVADDFAARMAKAVDALSVGPGTREGTAVGPLIDKRAVDRCAAQVEGAVAQGARLLSGGKPHLEGPNFFTPTLLADVTPAMRIWREETFGPVAGITSFETEAEAIALANDSEYGLAAYVQTGCALRASRVPAALSYGMVGVNTVSFTGPPVPFGGTRLSGLGREGSTAGIEAFTELKYTCFAAA